MSGRGADAPAMKASAMPSILIGGDIYPAGRIQRAFEHGDADAIFHDLRDEIANADLAIVNLESPLVDTGTPIPKSGPVLGAPTSCIKGFAAAGWHVLNLANNHSFDHGAVGLKSTMQAIRGAGLDYVGAGDNLSQARMPLVREIRGQRVVIYAMAEREFSIADRYTPGANPLDMMDFVRAIREYKQGGVFIVLVHGGAEYYPYPPPEMMRRSRFMVDMGADAVVCCHTHCPLPWELYSGRPIVYGLGNLIFEAMSDEADPWYQGYLAKLEIKNGAVRFTPVPYVQSCDRPGARRMEPTELGTFHDLMASRGQDLDDEEALQGRWLEYCRSQRDSYLAMLFGYGRVMFRLRRTLLRALHSKQVARRALLLVQCETHRERLIALFQAIRHRDQEVSRG